MPSETIGHERFQTGSQWGALEAYRALDERHRLARLHSSHDECDYVLDAPEHLPTRQTKVMFGTDRQARPVARVMARARTRGQVADVE